MEQYCCYCHKIVAPADPERIAMSDKISCHRKCLNDAFKKKDLEPSLVLARKER
jgi:hypothetical protein